MESEKGVSDAVKLENVLLEGGIHEYSATYEGDEDDEEDSCCDGKDVQLGFLVDYLDGNAENAENGGVGVDNDDHLFYNTDWRDWDGGKVGGKPIWLNPVQIPSPSELKCQHCEETLSFLLQIYCPLDEVIDAFHRSLYIFCCRQKSCVEHKEHPSIKCVRMQLPRKNTFYAENPDTDTDTGTGTGNNNNGDGNAVLPRLCCVCG